MNLAKGQDNVLYRRTQYPIRNFLYVPPIDRVRGMRFGLARRLLGVVEGRDILPPELARRLNKKQPNAVYRWETGEDLPRTGTVDELVAMCQRVGLPITAGWLERGENDLPLIAIPASALTPAPEEPAKPTHVTPLKRNRKAAPRGAQPLHARKRDGSSR